MKTIWVLGYDHYYPAPDNFLASFHTREEANEYIANHTTVYGHRHDQYQVVDISDRL